MAATKEPVQPASDPPGSKRPADDDEERPVYEHDYANDDEYLNSQVRIDGFPKYSKKLVEQRLLKNIGVVGIRRVKKQNNQDFAFVYFESKSARYEGEKLIQGHVWKGRELNVTTANPMNRMRLAGDPKRQRTSDAGGGDGAGVGAGAAASCSGSAPDKLLRSAADVVTPLHAMPYEEQLVRKRKGLVDALTKLPKEMSDAARGVPDSAKAKFKELPWLQPSHIASSGGLAVPLGEVIPARLRSGYRNKCEFSFGRDAAGQPCLGFQLGQIKLVGAVVGPPDECPNVSDEMKAVVARIQSFLLTSPLPPYNRMDGSGFWRQVTARQAFNPPPPPLASSPAGIAAAQMAGADTPGSSSSGTPLLLVFLVAKSAAAEEVVSAEKKRLVEHLTASAYPMPLRLSLAMETADARGEAAAGGAEVPAEQLFGPSYIEERIHSLTYRVSPAAFFQVNTPGAEQLCELLRSVCNVGPNTVLLDVCCGTGTLGLSLASSVKRVIGVEICLPAVKDARANAARNKVGNATFMASKAEHATKGLLDSLTDEEKANLVAIVDPPRAGLHHDVIKALRACLPLTKLIFIACHAPSFVSNSAPLCRPTSTSFAGAPFAPVQAYGLDLFPHTAHCELVVVLERSGDGTHGGTDSG